jgi:DNA-directed RNA polymerase subunit beta'
MRTFHIGGVAGAADITRGLPRVEEIFEARTPRGKALLSEVSGVVKEVIQKGNQHVIRIAVDTGGKKKKDEEKEYVVPAGTSILVSKGDLVGKGTQLTEGNRDLKEMLALHGEAETGRYILNETSSIYSNQGAHINEKYIEVVIRQMFSRVRVTDGGDTKLLPGAIVERGEVIEANKELTKKQTPATYEQLLLGITKVALTTQSFLSAASFQETTKVLTNAATQGRIDNLNGLKENVIIGRLVPAGTGFRVHEELEDVIDEDE